MTDLELKLIRHNANISYLLGISYALINEYRDVIINNLSAEALIPNCEIYTILVNGLDSMLFNIPYQGDYSELN